nr:MAG TPA: hypothetical protein [Caudoviricetes sp.]
MGKKNSYPVPPHIFYTHFFFFFLFIYYIENIYSFT